MPSASLDDEKKSCFPSISQHSGFLDVREHAGKPWKRRYMAVNNNVSLIIYVQNLAR